MRRFFTFAFALLQVLAIAGPATAAPQAPATIADTPGYYFLLGRHLEDSGKIDEAIAAHKKAIELAPRSAELRAELAALYGRQDRARDAVETAEAALQLDPANREANRVIGSTYAALSEQRQPLRPGDDRSQYRPRAIAALERSRREAGVDLNTEFMLGRLYLQSRLYPKAIASLQRVTEDQPGYPEAAMLLAAAQDAAGLKRDAIATLEMSLEMNPGFFRGHIRLAEMLEQQGRLIEAADAYVRAQAANPRVDLTPRRASVLMRVGKAAEARDLVQAALAKKGSADASLLYILAQTQRRLKDATGTAATLARMRAEVPEDPRTRFVAAQILGDQGRQAEAIEAFRVLVESAPDDASLVYEYASALEKSGRQDDAERALRGLLSKDPFDANALNSLGYMLAERGQRLEEAIDLVQRALKVDPLNPSYLDSLGWAYFRQGKLEMADAPLSQAAEQLPSDSTVQDHLGDLRFKQQRFTDAAAAWERALKGDGGDIDRAKVEQKVRDARARVAR